MPLWGQGRDPLRALRGPLRGPARRARTRRARAPPWRRPRRSRSLRSRNRGSRDVPHARGRHGVARAHGRVRAPREEGYGFHEEEAFAQVVALRVRPLGEIALAYVGRESVGRERAAHEDEWEPEERRDDETKTDRGERRDA